MDTVSGLMAAGGVAVPAETGPGSADGDDRGPAVLVINPDLPKPGLRFHEFMNTVGLARYARVGLVTQLERQADWVHVRALEAGGVTVYAAGPYQGAAAGGGAGAVPGGAPRPGGRLRRWLHVADRMLGVLDSAPPEARQARRTLANLAGPMLRALGDGPWQVAVIVQSRFAAFSEALPAGIARVLVLHDVRTVLLARQAAVAAGWRARAAALLDAGKVRRFERAWLPRFRQVLCLTTVDAGHAARWTSPDRVAVVPLPVDLDYFRPVPPSGTPEPVLLFPGTMNYEPNIDAAAWFARSILPLIRRAAPRARFVIAGANPGPAVTGLASLPGVEVTGFLPDMRDAFARADIVVVPLRIGSGARNKILEAWASGRPVVTTTVGAEGLDVRDGDNVRLADTPEAVAAAVLDLAADAGARDRLTAAGRRSAEAHERGRVAERYAAAVLAAAPAAGRPFDLCFDLRWMVPGSAGGLEQMARGLLGALLELDRFNRYCLITPSQCRFDFRAPNVRVLHRDSPAADLRRVGRAVTKRLLGRLGGSFARLPSRWALDDHAVLGADLVYSFPGFINPELWHQPRHLVSVPDIQHEYFPQFFSEEAVAERRRLFDQSLARATHISAISAFTARTLVERLAVAPERITVVPLAADPVFRPAADAPSTARLLRDRLGLEAGGYLYFPAHTWPHKNHAVVIEALARLRDRHGLTPLLVCTGNPRGAQPALRERIERLGLTGQIRFLGYLPRQDQPLLYQGAAALVFPSLFEGFGMPVLEAMACGCPVVAADSSSLPEVAGDAGILLDPDDADPWCAALRDLLLDGALRARLAALGQQRAPLFSWRRTALETLALIRRLLTA